MDRLKYFEPWLIAHPAGAALIRVLFFVVPILLIVPMLIWWERRLLSWMQDRIGPNRVATITFKSGKKLRMFGLLQAIMDGIKLAFKEDITPTAVDRLIYFLAPGLALFPAFAIGATLPWGPQEGICRLLTPVANVEIGVLFVMAISSLGVYGIVLAGYASNNKYSLMGGLRSSAQLISYELAMGMALASVVLATGSLKMTEMLEFQAEPLWGVQKFFGIDNPIQNWLVFTPFGFIAAVIFAICVVAETNRTPFDLPEAENELIAGYHTEYSSMKFAVFFMGEYAAMFVFSGVFATIFLGGYNIAPIRALEPFSGLPYIAPMVFLGKCAFGITVFIWMRATLPRLRYDQLMSLGWRSLLPLAVANFIGVGIWVIGTNQGGQVDPWAGLGAWFIAFAIFFGLYMAIKQTGKERLGTALDKRTIELVSGNPANAIAFAKPDKVEVAVEA
ncbi:MAG: complex I subunit 1 family protein [Fimbriimonadaceae bacterium]